MIERVAQFALERTLVLDPSRRPCSSDLTPSRFDALAITAGKRQAAQHSSPARSWPQTTYDATSRKSARLQRPATLTSGAEFSRRSFQ